MKGLIKINWGGNGYDLIEVDIDEVEQVYNIMRSAQSRIGEQTGEQILDDICAKVLSARVITDEVFEIETDIELF